jgi:hypothetical protein
MGESSLRRVVESSVEAGSSWKGRRARCFAVLRFWAAAGAFALRFSVGAQVLGGSSEGEAEAGRAETRESCRAAEQQSSRAVWSLGLAAVEYPDLLGSLDEFLYM